jgi:hypothetical protein
MFTTSFILRHINSLPERELFTTRDLLCYGSRSAVDKALSRMVKAERIERLARGVFVRIGWVKTPITHYQIAAAKARAFGKTIADHVLDFADRLGIPPDTGRQTTFDTTGFTSSFRTKDSVIRWKQMSPRKIKLGDSTAGLIARSLWQLGQSLCTSELVREVTARLSFEERRDLREYAGLTPAWLNAYFREVIAWTPRLVVNQGQFCLLQ